MTYKHHLLLYVLNQKSKSNFFDLLECANTKHTKLFIWSHLLDSILTNLYDLYFIQY